MAAIFDGVAMDFGASDVAISTISSAIGTMTVQSWDVKKLADKDEVRDANGVVVTASYYNPSLEATFEAVVSGTGLANAKAQVILPGVGTLATVTSTNYTWIASTSWIIEDAQVKATNTKNKMVSFKLKNYPAITAVASA